MNEMAKLSMLVTMLNELDKYIVVEVLVCDVRMSVCEVVR